jgi:hypothetical protein
MLRRASGGTLDSARRRYGTCCGFCAADVMDKPNKSDPSERIRKAVDVVWWVTGTAWSQL